MSTVDSQGESKNFYEWKTVLSIESYSELYFLEIFFLLCWLFGNFELLKWESCPFDRNPGGCLVKICQLPTSK